MATSKNNKDQQTNPDQPNQTDTPVTEQGQQAPQTDTANANDQTNEEKKPDETVPGGAYVVNGVVVDANGEPRKGWTVDKKTGSAVPPVVAPVEKPEE